MSDPGRPDAPSTGGVVRAVSRGGVAAGAGAVDGGAAEEPRAPTRPLVSDCPSTCAPGTLPGAAAVPRAGPDDARPGLVRLGCAGTGSGARGCAVFSDVLHGKRRKRLRGRSLPNQLATEGPTRSARTRATPTPSAMRNQRALKMLGGRRIRCDTFDLTRLILEFPKYNRMLAGQC